MRHPDGTYDLTIDDIHEIRERNYELTKNMSSSELIEYCNRKGREAAKSLGLFGWIFSSLVYRYLHLI